MKFITISIVFAVSMFILKTIIEITSDKKRQKKFKEQNRRKLYVDKVPILTPTELIFYKVLKDILPEDTEISCKIRLEDIMNVNEWEDWKDKQRQRNMIKSSHVDFLLWDLENGKPIIAIELDDPSHDKTITKIKDYEKNQKFKIADIPLLRVKTEKEYNLEKLITDIQECIYYP